tara:strand:+ start:258 stop:2066 length:1809 start_codon:yes stop_codon:yes gene_type:complete
MHMKFSDSDIQTNEAAGTVGLGKRFLQQFAEDAAYVAQGAQDTVHSIETMAPDDMPSYSLVTEARRLLGMSREAAELADDLTAAAAKVKETEDAMNTVVDPPGGGEPEYRWSRATTWAPELYGDEHSIPASGVEPVILVVADPTNPHGITMALVDAADTLYAYPAVERGDIDIVIEVPAGTYRDFAMASGSQWDPKFISGSIFDARSVNIVGPAPERELRYDPLPGSRSLNTIVPSVVIEPGRPKPGGDAIYISGGGGDGIRPRAHANLRLFGVQVNCAGRSALHPSPGNPFVLEAAACHFGQDATAVAAGTDMKWLWQMYRTSPRVTECSFDAPNIQEHLLYTHGHADGVDMWMRRCVSTGNGGQVLQCTERAYDVPDAGMQFFDVEDCVFTGFHKFAGRAGSAITFAGSGLHGRMTDTVVVDDDPTDTSGQTGSRVGTNYGALTVWNPQGEEESYASTSGRGRGNASFHATGCVFAVRNGNRPVAALHDAHSLRLRACAFLGAPAEDGQAYNAAGAQMVSLNYELERKLPISHVDVDLTDSPHEGVMDRFYRTVKNGERSSYVPVFWQYGDVGTQSNGARLVLKAEFNEAGVIQVGSVRG